MPSVEATGPTPPRREFLKGLGAFALAATAGAVPVGVGVNVFLNPLRQPREGDGTFVRITTLDALPADGMPRRFAVLADHVNVWNRTAAVPVGAVYLRRTGESDVRAFNVICPHAGCVVDYAPAREGFLCPCHNSTFALDGAINDPKSPSPRGLDELAVEVRERREVWVRFQNYRAGIKERLPA